MTFVAFWCLLVYDGCWIVTIVAYDVCRLWRLSPIMAFVAYRVCRSIEGSIRGNCSILLRKNCGMVGVADVDKFSREQEGDSSSSPSQVQKLNSQTQFSKKPW